VNWIDRLARRTPGEPGGRAEVNGALDSFENLVLSIVASLACPEAAHLKNVYAEGLEPGQQPLQSRKIGKLAVQDGLDRLYGSAEVLEVE
jgi:hypothetical protein